MPRNRQKPINPFIERLRSEHLTDEDGALRLPTLKELANILGISYRQLLHYADINGSHQTLEAILRDAKALGMTTDEFITSLLGITS